MKVSIAFVVCAVVVLGQASRAHSEVTSTKVHRIYGATFAANSPFEEELRYVNINFQDGSRVKMTSPDRWAFLLDKFSTALIETHLDLERLFGVIPPMATSLRLVDNTYFFRLTGAPSWAFAVYFHGEIVLRLDTSSKLDLDKFYRAIRHEYTHAVIHRLSGGKCPVWLDEGLAQWAEGSSNPEVVRLSLQKWPSQQPPLKLYRLRDSFTQLEPDLASLAYARSFFAVQRMIDIYGFESIRLFLEELKQGRDNAVAFMRTFSTSEDLFEENLDRALLQLKN